MKALTVIGARPQFIKAAAISRAIRNHFAGRIKEILVHTGQHYDKEMSAVFFEQLGIPKEDYNLQTGSGSHGVQTAKIIIGLEEIIVKEQPDLVILYGDTNSTLAGAVTASKCCVPIVHIEAGMRSFTKNMPEEINRIMCDHVSTLLFSPTLTGVRNLYREGFPENNKGPWNIDNPKVFHCGDIMYDNSIYFRDIALKESKVLHVTGVTPGNYSLVTVHRQNNTDDRGRLKNIFEALAAIALREQTQFVVPLHPRTAKVLETSGGGFQNKPGIKIISPVSYLDMIMLESEAEMVITDSGGVQKEAYYFHKPCIILQEETAWVELIESQCAMLVDADPQRIEDAFHHFRNVKNQLLFKPLFGDGAAAEFTVGEIVKCFSKV
ncbi:MAG TPA: UDP-N-acetylglucosamine 2-epimerase (non-hydrolyzing) [Bacteroidia bacterium]|nr:UDP-N-acetylglucosamine 2-epimerase (non-hydrolyzing) [Bacteroidia bacterium]